MTRNSEIDLEDLREHDHLPETPVVNDVGAIVRWLCHCGEEVAPPSSMLTEIRALGWSVAVHNDYRLEGEPRTFWGFTREDRWVKGEGRTDDEALSNAIEAIRALRPLKFSDDRVKQTIGKAVDVLKVALNRHRVQLAEACGCGNCGAMREAIRLLKACLSGSHTPSIR